MEIVLSKRLETIASFIPKGVKFADIGSDHAYIPCAICKKDKATRAIAGEVKTGPLQSAQKTVDATNLNRQVDVRLGDGLDVIDRDVTHVIIAGMGGTLIESILEQGKQNMSTIQQIIVQPNIGSNYVRKWLCDNGYYVSHEKMVEEKKHIYEIIVANKANSRRVSLSPKEIYLGPLFLRNKSDLFRKKWERELVHLRKIVEQMKQSKQPDMQQINQFRQQILWIEEELNHES